MALLQAPALDPTIQVPSQDLPLGVLQSLADRYGDTMARAFEHIEERRFASQQTCLITRPLTAYDLKDIETIKPEPELRHDRRIVDARGEIVNLEKGYFSGHPEPFSEPGKHRGKCKEPKIEVAKPKKTWKQRRRTTWLWFERQLKKVGLAYDE